MLASCDQPKRTTQDEGQQAKSQPTEVPDSRVENPYPTASKVQLFVEKGYTEKGEPILTKPSGKTLNAIQRAKFEKAMVLTMPPTETVGCFIPHHFFRYFDRSGKQVGEVAVCFCCGGVRASGEGSFPAVGGQILSIDYDQVKDLVRELGEPTNVLCD